jgi:hypothetical protein
MKGRRDEGTRGRRDRGREGKRSKDSQYVYASQATIVKGNDDLSQPVTKRYIYVDPVPGSCNPWIPQTHLLSIIMMIILLPLFISIDLPCLVFSYHRHFNPSALLIASVLWLFGYSVIHLFSATPDCLPRFSCCSIKLYKKTTISHLDSSDRGGRAEVFELIK